MTRSLMSMLIKASTLGKTFEVVSEGDTLYTGKNPRDAFQVIRELDEVSLRLVNTDGSYFDWCLLTPGDTYAYICDCWAGPNLFFDNWEI